MMINVAASALLASAALAGASASRAREVFVGPEDVRGVVKQDNQTAVLVLYDGTDPMWRSHYRMAMFNMSEELADFHEVVIARGDVSKHPKLANMFAPRGLPDWRVFPHNIPGPAPVVLDVALGKKGENFADDVRAVMELTDPAHHDVGHLAVDMYNVLRTVEHLHKVEAAHWKETDEKNNEKPPLLTPEEEEARKKAWAEAHEEAQEQIHPGEGATEGTDWIPEEHAGDDSTPPDTEPPAPPSDTDPHEEVEGPPGDEGRDAEESAEWREMEKKLAHPDEPSEDDKMPDFDPEREAQAPMDPEGFGVAPNIVDEVELHKEIHESMAENMDYLGHDKAAEDARKELMSIRAKAHAEARRLGLRAHRMQYIADLAERMEHGGLSLLLKERNVRTQELLSLPTDRNEAADYQRGKLLVEVSTLHKLIEHAALHSEEATRGFAYIPTGLEPEDGEVPQGIEEDIEYLKHHAMAEEDNKKVDGGAGFRPPSGGGHVVPPGATAAPDAPMA